MKMPRMTYCTMGSSKSLPISLSGANVRWQRGYLRKQKRITQLVVNEEQLPDIPDEASIADSGSRLSEQQLMAFVAELPDGCRTVFNLYVFEEKSHKEIAEMLGIKVHSSTSQLHRAKNLLAKRIKEYTEYERK